MFLHNNHKISFYIFLTRIIPLFFLLPFFLLGYYLDPWINWSRHYLLLGSVAALFVFTYLVRLLFLHDPVVTWHPASGTLLKPFFHLLNIKLPG